MYAVYGPPRDEAGNLRQISEQYASEADACAYLRDVAVCCDTSQWAVYPVSIMQPEKSIGDVA